MIPNWIDTSELLRQPRRNAWSAEQGVDDAFVVMHSGNVGHAQDLDTLVRAATFLRDLERLQIMVIGFRGAARGALRSSRHGSTSRTRSAPRLPAARTPAALARRRRPALRRARARALRLRRPEAAVRDPRPARPVLVSADADSETVRLVQEAECQDRRPARPPRARGASDPRRHGAGGSHSRAWRRTRAAVGRARGRPRGRVGRYRRLVGELASAAEQLAVERVDVADEPLHGTGGAPALAAGRAHRRPGARGSRASTSSRSAIAVVSPGPTRVVSPSSTTSGTPPTAVARPAPRRRALR